MRFNYFSLGYTAVLLMLVHACAPAVTEQIVTEPEPAPRPEPKESLTTCKTLDELDNTTRSATEDAYVLYRDQVRFKKYDAAVDLWKKAYYTAPGANGRVTYHFDDGIKIYNHFFANAATREQQAGIVDTLLSIYDKRMECFEDDGTILARKAFDSYYTYREYVDMDDVFDQFREVMNRKGKEADYFIINPFSRLLYDNVLDEKISHEDASEIAYQIFDAIDHGKETCEDEYCEAWEVIDEYSPDLLSGLEGLRGFYNCEYYMDRYYNQFLEDTTDCDNVTEVYLKMVWASCDPEDARFVRLKETKEKVCYVAPPPPGPLRLAGAALNEGRFKEAIEYYDQYVSESDDTEKKASILLRISKIYYAHIKNFPAARQYAREAAKQKPNWGEPYILIGKLYASSGPLCGPGRGWDSQIVTWPAIDQFQYAKQIDPTVADEANKWINRYAQYMPSVEDIFQRQLKEGSSFKVGCWIQESTTIRAAR